MSGTPQPRFPGPVPKLVIFDCDGVLVDSEPISIAVLVEHVAAAGHALEVEAAYARFLGRSMTSVREGLADDPGLELGEAGFEAMRAKLHERLRCELRPVPGVEDALRCLPMRRCVASSSQPDRIRLSLEVTGLLPLLDPHLFSASMVSSGKPAPDLFLYAAERMDVSPADCLVIEDSEAGIEAAKRAGMRVFAFTGGSHAVHGSLVERARALEPDCLFDNMAHLPRLLGCGGE